MTKVNDKLADTILRKCKNGLHIMTREVKR